MMRRTLQDKERKDAINNDEQNEEKLTLRNTFL